MDQDAAMDAGTEFRISRNPTLRLLWRALGLLFTGLGVLGYLLPLMPGTVFLIAATFFFSRSSPRLYRWLLDNRLFGGVLRDWVAGRRLARQVKLMIVIALMLSIGISSVLTSSWYLRAGLLLVGLAVGLYIWTRPAKPGD